MLGRILKIFLIILFVFISVLNGKSQEIISSDTTYLQETNLLKIHSPHKAAIYSALIPGLGQIYNKKYWKLPIIYGATGIVIYAFDYNNDQYNKFKNAYARMTAGEIDNFEGYTSETVLLNIKNSYRRYRELNVIILAGVYILNIIDATVDAHLFDYKITDDLSLNVQPTIEKTITCQDTYGVSLHFSLK